MEKDESGTLGLLQGIRADVVDPTTARFRGRIVKSTGDGWLAEFASVTAAVRSSLEIQDPLTRRNMAASRRLELRIGVNLGEIIFEGDDVYGTGVNVAARLESHFFYDHWRNRALCISMESREDETTIGIMEEWVDGILANSQKVQTQETGHAEPCAEPDSVLIQHPCLPAGR